MKVPRSGVYEPGDLVDERCLPPLPDRFEPNQDKRCQNLARMPDGSGSRLHSVDLRSLARDPYVIGVAGLLFAAAVLRLSTLGLQSYSGDEAFTVRLVRKSPVEMLHGIARTESTPPLYYGLAWVWSRLFGTGEAGLRSLSALFGIATVLVAYLAGARLVSRAAGLVVAALTAVSPFMVWYSQEARSYALFMLLATLSIYLYACLREDARPAVVVAWGAVCAAAIWTHYFAIYVVAMEALLLIVLVPRVRRAVAAALLAVVLVSVPVAALAIHQARSGNPNAIADVPLGDRLKVATYEFVAGTFPLWQRQVTIALLVGFVVALLVSTRSRSLTRVLAEVALLGTGVVMIPLVATALGKDYWFGRNVMPAWICAAMVLAVGMVSAQRRWVTWVLAAALVSLSLVPTLLIFERHELQRPDYRGLARCLGPQRRHRAIVFRSAGAPVALGIYRPETVRLRDRGKVVNEIDFVQPPRGNLRVPTQFASAGTACETTIRVSRFTARKPTRLSAHDLLAPSRMFDAEVFIDQPRA